MKKLQRMLVVFLLLMMMGFNWVSGNETSYSTVPQVFAVEDCPGNHQGVGVTLPEYTEGMSHEIMIDTSRIDKSCDSLCELFKGSHYIKVKSTRTVDDEIQTDSLYLNNDYVVGDAANYSVTVKGSEDKIVLTIYNKEALESSFWSYPGDDGDTHQVYLYIHKVGGMFDSGSNRLCRVGEYYTPKKTNPNTCQIVISQQRSGNTCYAYSDPDLACMIKGQELSVKISNLKDNSGNLIDNQKITFRFNNATFGVAQFREVDVFSGQAQFKFTAEKAGTYIIQSDSTQITCKYDQLVISDDCPNTGACYSNPDPVNNLEVLQVFDICQQIKDIDQLQKCYDCAGLDPQTVAADSSVAGIWTAVGCIPTKPESILKTVMKIGLSIAGGVAFLMIISAGFSLSISQGDPKETSAARDRLTAAVIGLLFIIFSVTILQLIGIEIFRIPGFGT